MQASRIQYLVQQYTLQALSPAEQEELLSLLNQPGNELQEILLEQLETAATQPIALPEAATLALFRSIVGVDKTGTLTERPPVPLYRRFVSFRRSWIAAAVLLLLGTGSYFWLQRPGRSAAPSTTATVADIQPGREGALLTLDDGSQVRLDSLKDGVIALQGGATVRVEDGILHYEGRGKETMVYNTMSTPKGRQFRLTLPDGTQVWLNSASSLHYPTSFNGTERKVSITGEAYFEVARNPQQPFRVNINNQAEVEVLGTHFNVNAYDNETIIATTLLQGSIRVTGANRSSATLQPGQQAELPQAGQPGSVQVIDQADIEKAMAWKNGLFSFENVSLEEIMRQLERWYDIEVVYESTIPEIVLTGEITRDVPLSDLLAALKKMGVQYRLDNRKLIILPS
ncbi:MAG: DUF4974 domain-containing protein [Candidatus Pseudobacter hemicellulosilyticus]|uniref:DUF4974 domain-containing protein n=1 Tax=Candidatus Pseudobacter hemicellulosilyticus TaxID=3121375 RepID=A0AAJ5WRZ0_9BACT|nr:MAG: DUF4974 domain-containing protein [Pseudobacter sp.]